MSTSGHPRLAIALAAGAALLVVLAVNIRSVRSRNVLFLHEGPILVASFVRDLASGDSARVVPYLTPELSKKLEGVRFARFLEKYTEYGEVESISRTGTIQVAAVKTIPYPEVAYYRTTVNYEKTPALVEVILVRTPREGLKVWSFSVDSGKAEAPGGSEVDPQATSHSADAADAR
jgi:hypothetical protein